MSAFGDRLIASVQETRAELRGEIPQQMVVQVPKVVDVRAVRQRTGLSQPEFAARFGFELGTLRNWEQGRRQPTGHARVLLMVIGHDPGAVDRALQDAA